MLHETIGIINVGITRTNSWNGWMDGWMDGWMHGWMAGCMDGLVHEFMDGGWLDRWDGLDG